jgi:glycosyltransferase involved in cell wall biosynthesis
MPKTKRILFVQFANPAGYPPLLHSSLILAENGWEVLFIGVRSFGTEPLKIKFHENIKAITLNYKPSGFSQKLQYLWYCILVTFFSMRFRPKFIYASDLLSCPIGYFLKRRGFKVVYHEHDFPTTEKASIFLKWAFAARRKLAGIADLCVLPNQKRVEKFLLETQTTRPVYCVWNCPMLREVAPQKVGALDEKKLSILYHGTIVPCRVPMTLIEALSLLPKLVNLKIIGYEPIGAIGYVNQILSRARELGIECQIQIAGPLNRGKILEVSENFDVGISFTSLDKDDINMQELVGASNKAFDYLACGLALLVSDILAWKKTFVETGYGLTCDVKDPKSIAESLEWFLSHKNEMLRMGEKGKQHILSDWNYEKQFKPVLEFITQNSA